MRIAGIIEARFRSTRLHGKVMMDILGEPMLARMIERLRRARTLDHIVLATTSDPADDAVAALAECEGIGVFRGSELDVLDRVVGAARSCGADLIVELTGDCPLVDPAMVDKVVADFRLGGADFVSNILPYTSPRGTDVRVFTTESLAEINVRSSDSADHEHVSLHYWEHPERYRLRNVETRLPSGATDLRLTVDTAEDLELVRAIYARLYPVNAAFTLHDVLALLRDHPQLREINSDVRQRAVR